MMWPGVVSEDGLIPETVLPVQFRAICSQGDAVSPERELMVAVLHEAVADVQRYRAARAREQHKLYLEACEWLNSDDTSWPYSFASLCATLGLSAEGIRDRLLGVGERHREEIPRAA
jgi:hypothetical protein